MHAILTAIASSQFNYLRTLIVMMHFCLMAISLAIKLLARYVRSYVCRQLRIILQYVVINIKYEFHTK